MSHLRRLAALLLTVALGLTVASAPAPAAPAAATIGLAITKIELLNTPVYGQAQQVDVETNKPAADGGIEIYWSPAPNAPLVDANRLASIGGDGTLSFPTSPRFAPGQTWYLVVLAAKGDDIATSTRIPFTVTPITTSLALGATTLEAHQRLVVTPVPSVDTGVPATGTVRLTGPGGSNLGTLALENGSAAFRVTPGVTEVTAQYSGDGRWTAASATTTVRVAKAVVTAEGHLSSDRVEQFDPVTLGVDLSSSEPAYIPAGAYTLLAEPAGGGADVVIREGGYEGAGLSFDLTAFAAGHVGTWDLHLLTSETDLHSFRSTRVGRLQVDRARVATGVTASGPTTVVAYGSPAARLSATLTRSRDNGPVDGVLQALEGITPTGAARPVTAADRAVDLPLPGLPVGRHTLSVAYLDGTSYAESESAPVVVEVRAATTATRLTAPAGGVRAGSTLRVAVRTTDSPALAGGRVTLREGGRPVASGVVRDGGALIRLPAGLRAGVHRFGATYAGSATHATSTSSVVPVRVTKAASKVTGTAAVRGRSAVLRARVVGPAGVAGRVQVLDGRRVVRSLALRPSARGRVTVTLPRLARGRHTLTLRYLGSTSVEASSRSWRVRVR